MTSHAGAELFREDSARRMISNGQKCAAQIRELKPVQAQGFHSRPAGCCTPINEEKVVAPREVGVPVLAARIE